MSNKFLETSIFGALLILSGTVMAAGDQCQPDSVYSGGACIDKYESSVWRLDPLQDRKLIKSIQSGTVTAAVLLDAEVTQLGLTYGDYEPCDNNGQDCPDIYAVSVPGVLPSVSLTWFQAQQACNNSGKRLPSNAEWQAAVSGTPDATVSSPDNGTTTCVTGKSSYQGSAEPTGSRSDCVSTYGAYDMVGNIDEMVADWSLRSGCLSYLPHVSDDKMCMFGAGTDTRYDNAPAALIRGGAYFDKEKAGPLSVSATYRVIVAASNVGFRCAR